MRWTRALLVFGTAALLVLACRGEAPPELRESGRLGRIQLFRTAAGQEPDALIFLFSDAAGFGAPFARAARELARRGSAVVGVDLPAYLHGLAASDDGCHYVVAELEELSHQLERELGFHGYRSPLLAGAGAGGTLAYAALAQAPAATVAGAVAVDPAPSLGTRVPLCEGAAASPAPGGGFRYATRAELPGELRIEPAAGDVSERLVTALEPLLEQTGAEGDVAGVLSDLPLVEIPAERPERLFAVIWSGDGGWRDLDKELGEILAKRGVPVVGVDCLRYFWSERKPEEVAADLSRILSTARAAWGTPRALLIGYSFGADILPFAVNRLSDEERSGVAQVTLLGPEAHAPFEIQVTGWLGQIDREAPAVLPELMRLDLSRVQCIYGEEDEDAICPAPELARAEIIRTAGGHHFDEDYDALAERVLSAARRRS